MAQAWLELSGGSVDVGGLRSFCSPGASQLACGPPYKHRAPHAAKAHCMGRTPTQLLPSLPANPSDRD